jgi:hypothetical protein
MARPRRVPHEHQPVYRVVRAGWANPLDASFSRRAADNRWSSAAFAALYCCCSPRVARAVTRDVLRLAGVEPQDLQPAYRPRMVEVLWRGEVIDVASPEGVRAAGFPTDYPRGVDKAETRRAAGRWHRAGAEGVVCRSASLARLGFADWSGDHERWGELAIFPENAERAPKLGKGHDDLGWLAPPAGGGG